MRLKNYENLRKQVLNIKKVIEINPDYAVAHYNLGNVLQELGDHPKAIKSYQRAIQIAPNYAEAHNNLGIVFQEYGEQKKSKKNCYIKAMENNPNYVNAYWNLHSLAPNIEEALKILIKLSDVDNTFSQS